MRHRSFNIDFALDGAMEAFWQKGYSATSIDDLCQNMNIGRSSLYQAFGSKAHLLEIVIERYTKRSVMRLSTNFAAQRPFKENMRAILEQFAAGAISGELRRGCMVGEMIAEFPAQKSRENYYLGQKVRILKAVIESAALAALEDGELSASTDARKLAHFLFATIQGLRLTGKVSPDEETLQAIIDAAMARIN